MRCWCDLDPGTLSVVRPWWLGRYLRVLTSTEVGRRSVPAKMIASVPNVVTFFSFFFILVSTFAVLGMQVDHCLHLPQRVLP